MSESQPHIHHDQTELEKFFLRSKPWLEQNGTILIYGLAGLLALSAVIVYLQRKPGGDTEASRELLLAVQPEEYRDVADNFPDTRIAMWARLRQADRLLDNAVTNMFTNRPVGIEELDQSEAAYKRLAERSDITEEIRERVLVGLARIAEVRCDGSDSSTDAAVAAWKRVIDEFKDSLVKKQAEDRIAELPTADTKAFYKWFHEQNPRPVDPGLAPGQPAVPEIPGFPMQSVPTTPAATDEAKPAADMKPEAAQPADAPGEAAKPAEAPAKPDAEAKPADAAAKPAADAKPAEAASDKPAATEPKTDAAATPAEPAKPAESAPKAEEAKPATPPAVAPAKEADAADGKESGK